MSQDNTSEKDTTLSMELIPVKGKILGEYSVRVSHQVAEYLRAHPESLKTFIQAIEDDIKENPEEHPEFYTEEKK